MRVLGGSVVVDCRKKFTTSEGIDNKTSNTRESPDAGLGGTNALNGMKPYRSYSSQ